MNRHYLKPELEIISIQAEEIFAQSGVFSEYYGMDYGGRDDGVIDPSVKALNDTYILFGRIIGEKIDNS